MKHINLRERKGSAADKALTPEERSSLLASLTNDKHRIILILGAYAGLRANEICQCRFSWLEKTSFNDHEVLRINIPDEDRDTRNKLKIWRPKTRKQRTTYIFESSLINELYFWFKNNQDGLRTSRQAIDKVIRSHFQKIINRDNFSTHALRSTATNYFLYEKNFSPSFVQIILGHADIRTTYKHYDSKTKASAEAYLMNKLS